MWCVVCGAEYQYTEDLLGLDRCRPVGGRTVPDFLRLLPSSLKWESWRQVVRHHRDKQFTCYILEGIRDRFRIGYRGRGDWHRPVQANMGSALEHPEVVREFLAEECREGRLVGPLPVEAVRTPRGSERVPGGRVQRG